MIRVFLADDHAMVRVGLRHVLEELGGFEVVGEAENGRQVLQAPELLQADGRMPFTRVAAEVGLTEGAIRQRVQRLTDAGLQLPN